MSDDDDWGDHAMDDRRRKIRETIRRATVEELKRLGEQHFAVANDPWLERYLALLTKNPRAGFYRASTPEGAEVVYCRDTEEGVWFLADSGMGFIQPKGLQVLREIVDAQT